MHCQDQVKNRRTHQLPSGLHACAADHKVTLNLANTQLRHVVEDVAALRIKAVRLVVRKAQSAQPVPIGRNKRGPAVEANWRRTVHVGIVLESACCLM